MSKKLIALAAVSLCLAAGTRKTKDEPAVKPTIYETTPNEKVIVDADVYKAYPESFREPTEDEAAGTFKDLTAKAAEKAAKDATATGTNARTAAGNGTGRNAGSKQTGLGGKDGDPTGVTGKSKEDADAGKGEPPVGEDAKADAELTG